MNEQHLLCKTRQNMNFISDTELMLFYQGLFEDIRPDWS